MKLPFELSPPQDFYVSTMDWVKSSKDNQKDFYEIYPELTIPKVARKEELDIIRGKPDRSNKAFVVIVPEGRVLSDRAVISPDNKLLWDVSVEWMKSPAQHSIFQKDQLPPVVRTNETVAMLNHPAGYNYFHWMLEALARVHLIQQSKIKIDKFIINHRFLPFQLDTLAACCIPMEKIIVPNKHFHLQAQRLIVPSYVNLPNAWSCKYVRNLLLTGKNIKKKDKYERIYIKRSHYRKIANEDEIVRILDKHGFRSISPETMPLQKQIKVFHSAKVIIAPHGAGLANLVFCDPETNVIELFSPSYVEPHYWMISRLLNLNYRFMIGKRENKDKGWSGRDDMAIDPKKLLRLLEKLVK